MTAGVVITENGNLFHCSGSSGSIMISRVFAVLLVLLVIVGLIIAGLFAMNQVADTAQGSVNAIVQLSGNDVVVTILGGEGADRISGLHAYIDGQESNTPANMKRSIVLGQPVIFTDLAKGVTGTGFVVVEAVFQDGARNVIVFKRMTFS
jgi:hypothetical protein